MTNRSNPRNPCPTYSEADWGALGSQTLRVSESFVSIQGEGTRAGLVTAFLRLSGCALRCRWCDTTYAFSGGEVRTLGMLEAEVLESGVRQVCVTGGEPLLQRAVVPLVERLISSHGLQVSLETGGDQPISGLPAQVSVILDIKLPGSGMADRMDSSNLASMGPGDEIKLVISDRRDYETARAMLDGPLKSFIGEVLFSAVQGELDPAGLAEWILADRLRVRQQVQLHKILWPEAESGT